MRYEYEKEPLTDVKDVIRFLKQSPQNPYYDFDTDYTTNSPSYYDYLAKLKPLIQILAERIYDYDKELAKRFEEWDELIKKFPENVEKLLIEWLEDGTLEKIINENIFKDLNDKIDKNNEDVLKLLEELREEIINILDNSSLVYTVGHKGDFKLISEVFNDIDNLPIKPKSIEVLLLEDFILNEQLFIFNKDYRNVIIKSKKDSVYVDSKKFSEKINVDLSPEFEILPTIYSKNSYLPIIDFKLVLGECMDNKVSGYLIDNSNLTFTKKGGATGFRFIGLCGINGSNIIANYCDFSNNGNRKNLNTVTLDQDFYGDGVRIWNSTFSGSYAKANRCGDMGFHITHGSHAYIDNCKAIECGHHGLIVTTGSTCSARKSEITDTIDDNAVAYASSKIDLRDSDCSGAKLSFGVIATRSSEINFERSKANNCNESGIMANRGSVIDATSSESNNNNKHGIECANNSKVDFTNGKSISNNVDGLHSTHGSTIQARLSNINNNKRNGILAFSGNVYADGVNCLNNGKRNIECTRGGYVAANNSILKKSGEKNVLSYGSKIFISNSTIEESGENGIEATKGGEITAENTKVIDSGYYGVLAYSSKIHISNSSIENSEYREIEATRGGEIIAYDITVDEQKEDVINVYNSGRIFTNSNAKSNIEKNVLDKKGLIMG